MPNSPFIITSRKNCETDPTYISRILCSQKIQTQDDPDRGTFMDRNRFALLYFSSHRTISAFKIFIVPKAHRPNNPPAGSERCFSEHDNGLLSHILSEEFLQKNFFMD